VSFFDEDELTRFLHRDDWLPMVTSEAVAKALDDFALSLAPGKDWDWLAIAVRRSLAFTMSNVNVGPERTSNSRTRDELKQLAGSAESTWQALSECDHTVNSCLQDFAFRNWVREDGTDINDGPVTGQPSEYSRFEAAVAELYWMAGFLSQAASGIESQRGPWRESEKKQLRIARGQCLARVFEAAFGQRPTANNYPDDARFKAPTAFMDFYDRMVKLAFGARETANLPEVVKEARRRHRKASVQFPEGMIPGL
jgi:hypothetical protein